VRANPAAGVDARRHDGAGIGAGWREARLICAVRLGTVAPRTIRRVRAGSQRPRPWAGRCPPFRRSGEARAAFWLSRASGARMNSQPSLRTVDVTAAHQNARRAACRRPAGGATPRPPLTVEAAGDAVEQARRHRRRPRKRCVSAASWRVGSRGQLPLATVMSTDPLASSAHRAWCGRRRAGASRCRPPRRAARGRSPAGRKIAQRHAVGRRGQRRLPDAAGRIVGQVKAGRSAADGGGGPEGKARLARGERVSTRSAPCCPARRFQPAAPSPRESSGRARVAENGTVGTRRGCGRRRGAGRGRRGRRRVQVAKV